jgi:hypothetical protein
MALGTDSEELVAAEGGPGVLDLTPRQPMPGGRLVFEVAVSQARPNSWLPVDAGAVLSSSAERSTCAARG